MKPLPSRRFTTRLTSGLIPAAVLALALPASAAITIQSYWQLGENTSNRGEDTSTVNDGEANPFNRSDGTTWNTSTPSGVNGSTTYGSTSGANFQGIWMFGGGSDTQTVPLQNWGIQFMVRSTDTATMVPSIGNWAEIFGMKDSIAGGLVIEIRRDTASNVYWDVNRKGQANLIIPRNATTLVTDNAWTALALVHNGVNLEFYVNKVLAGSIAATFGTTYQTDGLFAFGLNST